MDWTSSVPFWLTVISAWEKLPSLQNIYIFTLLTSLIRVSGIEKSYHCWCTAWAGEKRPQIPDQPFFYVWDCSIPHTHKVWGQLEGWLRKKDISCLFRAPLCEQREGSQLLLASSHCSRGQSDGFISARLILSLSQKLRGGEGFRSTSWPLPWWRSDRAAAGYLDYALIWTGWNVLWKNTSYTPMSKDGMVGVIQ